MKKFGLCHHRRQWPRRRGSWLTGPAQADIGHHDWVHVDTQQHATVGSVTPTFGNGR